jgi:hypothetical protein
MNSPRILTLGGLIVLAGCSASARQPQTSCEVMAEPICSRVAEAQLHDGTLTVGYASRPNDARVVPFVVPMFRTDGVLAAEVDCYANTDSRTFSMIRSDLAIPPSSWESVDFLKDRGLCAENGSYAEKGTLNGERTANSRQDKTLLANVRNYRDKSSDKGER